MKFRSTLSSEQAIGPLIIHGTAPIQIIDIPSEHHPLAPPVVKRGFNVAKFRVPTLDILGLDVQIGKQDDLSLGAVSQGSNTGIHGVAIEATEGMAELFARGFGVAVKQ